MATTRTTKIAITTKAKRRLGRQKMKNYLRSAHPQLIIRAEHKGSFVYKLTPYISEIYQGWDKLIDEGYNPDSSLLGCSVYWRIIKRGEKLLYLSTFPVTRDDIIRDWGPKGLAYCDSTTGLAVARIETLLEHSDGN